MVCRSLNSTVVATLGRQGLGSIADLTPAGRPAEHDADHLHWLGLRKPDGRVVQSPVPDPGDRVVLKASTSPTR
eukprot:15436691-Alexandrium_andersonii.AAC.1